MTDVAHTSRAVPKPVREVRCLTCGRLNRVPRYKITRIPQCGSPGCGVALPELPITKGLRYLYRVRNYAGATVIGVLAVLALRAVRTEFRPIAEWIVVASLAIGTIVYLGIQKRNKPSAKAFAGQLSAYLKAKVSMLATRALGSQEDIGSTPFVLSPSMVSNLGHQELVKALLQHVDKVAPLLEVPFMVPRIVIERLCDAAGQFVEDEEGWVRIVVGMNFFNDMPAARAILCHELCHYILGANGIRAVPTIENERLTDVAIFVFGLGDIFLAGYQRAPETNYRVGHRLGYLSDHDYAALNRYVHQLRSSDEFLRKPSKVERDFNNTFTFKTKAERERIVLYYMKKFGCNRTEAMRRAIEDWKKDNR
jgi:hypothetical protein